MTCTIPAHSGLPDITLLLTSKEGEAAEFMEGWGGRLHLGLDLEWKPTFRKGEYSRAATLQICSGARVLVFDLTAIRQKQARPLPTALWNFLEDDNHWFYGMGLLEDAARLAFEFDCLISGVDFVEGKAHPGALQLGGGLTGVANRVLGTAVQQSKRVSRSNWDARPLTEAQLRYIAEDAYLSWALAEHLLLLGPSEPQWLLTPAEIYGHGKNVRAAGHAVKDASHDWEAARAEHEEKGRERDRKRKLAGREGEREAAQKRLR
eukprot:CAMPEP_0171107858 /NCGR_PEP_ID=MMETSP0766_2-20121228/67717_1 /TAXON_ID=439317 /ORGANISM="Gambierdiscus australes, Strain CAWD 149" /LENGTH=262 /DNA_ID=CAMNT_0011569263 /DNA_START=66 /DNA_END=854 /DNA_ORIENTATION=+